MIQSRVYSLYKLVSIRKYVSTYNLAVFPRPTPHPSPVHASPAHPLVRLSRHCRIEKGSVPGHVPYSCEILA